MIIELDMVQSIAVAAVVLLFGKYLVSKSEFLKRYCIPGLSLVDLTFKILGKDYDAAVITAGHFGFGLGATPNGITNMTSVVAKYGPSPTAFFVMPLVGDCSLTSLMPGVIVFFINLIT